MASDSSEYSALDDAELAAAERAAVTEFNAIADTAKPTSATVSDLAVMAEKINMLRAEQASRVQAGEQLAELRDMVNNAMASVAGPGNDDDDEAGDDVADVTETVEAAAPAVEADLVLASDGPRKVDVRDVLKSGNKLNASLSQAARYAPEVPSSLPREMVLTASSDIPGYTQGAELAGMPDLVRAMQRRSKNLKDRSDYVPVASFERTFNYTINNSASEESIYATLQAATNPEVLTAAGGWCAPSMTSYDFFNVICEDGMIDLPTVGITRGGLRFPTSPSFGDMAGQVWTWTETQDIAAVTGTDQSGVKPCFRVPCPEFTDVRLDCTGICLTVGNLTQDAFPELIANHTRLLMGAMAHFVNNRIITQLCTGSTAVTFTPTGHGWAAPLLEATELQVMDYRIKYRMCDDVLLEAVYPSWAYAGFRADLAKRQGLAEFDVTDEMIRRWFSLRGVRAQFVQDWQVGGVGQLGQDTPSTAWPATMQFLLYAAGTWVKGNGLTLDLGVIRDSTLNATNDFTAAWMEECFLLAMIGHESRCVTVPICANGSTAAPITMNCTL